VQRLAGAEILHGEGRPLGGLPKPFWQGRRASEFGRGPTLPHAQMSDQFHSCQHRGPKRSNCFSEIDTHEWRKLATLGLPRSFSRYC
jgi:hypothetical protein